MTVLQIGLEALQNNLFSKHDNRHTVGSSGTYLGGRYGKKHMLDPTRNQQFSQSNHTNWGVLVLYKSTYTSGYSSDRRDADGRLAHSRCSSAATECCSHSTAKAKGYLLERVYTAPTKDNFRRFPKRYSLPKEMHTAKPSINAIWWPCSQSASGAKEGKSPHTATTPLSLLGASQQPYLKNNPWKYSYKQQNYPQKQSK